MSRKLLAALAVTGLLSGALIAASTLSGGADSDVIMIESGGLPSTFVDMGGAAYVVSGFYQGTAEVDSFSGFAVVIELENPMYLGDDSPDTPTQTPAPQLSEGEVITIHTREFDADAVVNKGDRVLAIVAHNSNFEPPWVTAAIASGAGDDVAMIGVNADPLQLELTAVAAALESDLESAFFAIAAEQLDADDGVRAGLAYDEAMGPALTEAAAARDEAAAANSLEAIWYDADPLRRGLQRGVAPDSLLDTLPTLYVIYSMSDEFIEQHPRALVEIRNELGVTSSIAADLGEGDDILYGSPGAQFEVTVVTDGNQEQASVIGLVESSQWSDTYAIAVAVETDANGALTATTRRLTEEEFLHEINLQTKHVAYDTAEEADRAADKDTSD